MTVAARRNTPALIRERAIDDALAIEIPECDAQQLASTVAVPIPIPRQRQPIERLLGERRGKRSFAAPKGTARDTRAVARSALVHAHPGSCPESLTPLYVPHIALTVKLADRVFLRLVARANS
jgi:hypothetical protein